MQYYFSFYKHSKLFYTLCLSVLLIPSCFASNTSDDTPINTLKSFYQLISQHKCKEAIKLRPDYALERCEKITKTHIHKLSTELSDNKNAVLLLELDSFVNNKKNYFFGYVKLTKKQGKWLIVGPFKNREDYWLDEYVTAYIPEGIKGLSAKEKEKKFAPPPIKKYNPEQTPAPIKEEQHKQTITPTKVPSHKAAKKDQQTPPPPGDSIDADEFEDSDKQSPVSIKKQALKTEIKEPTNPEADKFLSGSQAIEGNYTSLLRKIRKNFPLRATSNILLIDQSRNTIYLYNNADMLLAFFPILSSDNSNFPSGLYTLALDNSLESEGSIIKKENQAIILNKIQKTPISDTGEARTKNKQNSRANQYYIRDLFDTDKGRSLQLSPIDNNKLQKLILPSTIAYKGQ